MLASMIAPHPVGSEAPSQPLGEEPVAGAHPDYLFALVAAPEVIGSATLVAVPVQSSQAQPVAVVKSSQWSMGIRSAAQHPLVRLVYGLSSAGAMGVSYSENKSIPWALLHGFIGPAYLAYVGWNRYTDKGNRNQGSADWWGGTAKAKVDDVKFEPFEADVQGAAWERGDALARNLSYSDFESGFKGAEVADIWEEDEPGPWADDEPAQEGSGFRW